MNDAQYTAVRDACRTMQARGTTIITGSWHRGAGACCALTAYARSLGVPIEDGLTTLGLSATQVNQFLLGFDGMESAEPNHPSFLAGRKLRTELGLG